MKYEAPLSPSASLPHDSPTMAITGTRTGVGRGLADFFLERGWTVFGCSRGPSSIDHSAYTHAQLDVADAARVRSWIREIWHTRSRLDAVVSNAAQVPRPAITAMLDDSEIDAVLATNVRGALIVTREAMRIMARQRRGRIVMIASMATAVHHAGTSLYSASKAAVIEAARVIATEGAVAGITCNVVAPSVVETEAFAQLEDSARRRALESLLIPRPVSVVEVAQAVEFFVRPESAAITGQTLYMGLIA